MNRVRNPLVEPPRPTRPPYHTVLAYERLLDDPYWPHSNRAARRAIKELVRLALHQNWRAELGAKR